MNDKVCVNKETHTLPILATEILNKQMRKETESENDKDEKKVEANNHHPVFIDALCEKLNCKPEEILDMELMLADTQPACLGGIYEEFIFSPRLDNLFNTYCSLIALIKSTQNGLQNEKNVRMIALYDNEEVGSDSAQGAGSMLTEHIIRRICNNMESP